MNGNKLTPEYLKRVAQFERSFPSAYAFLKRIEHRAERKDLWLSTAVNAHLYKTDAFLAYLKLKNPELAPPSLLASPRFNQQIAAHTVDRSSVLFPVAFDQLVARYEGICLKHLSTRWKYQTPSRTRSWLAQHQILHGRPWRPASAACR